MPLYSEKLKDPHWQKLRLKIFQRDKFKCQMCNDNEEELHVHHLRYSNYPWSSSDSDLITLCKPCHDSAEHTIKKIRELSYDSNALSIFDSVVDLLNSGLGKNVSELLDEFWNYRLDYEEAHKLDEFERKNALPNR